MLLFVFPAHAAVGYLAGTYTRYSVAALLLGSLLPDIVDRPLLWSGLAPHTHTVGHSLLVAVPLSALAVAVFGQQGVAFALGWLAHLAGDLVNVATTAGPSEAPPFVLFPLLDPEGGQAFATVVVSPPLLDTPHFVHPAVLVAEAVVLVWATVVLARDDQVRKALSAVADVRE